MTGNPAVEPTGGEETSPGGIPWPPGEGGEAGRAGEGGGAGGATVPYVSSGTPAVPPVTPPAAPGASGTPLPSYGPPSYSPGYGQPAYGSGYGGPGPAYPPGPAYGAVPAYGAGPAYGPGPGYGQPGMRAATADRERTLDVLKAAYGEGRLTDAEFDSRTARTMAAKYYGELAAIVADLPSGPFAPQGPGYYPPAVPVTPTNGLAVGSLVCSLVGLIMPLMLVPGIVMGHIARDQIRAREQRGDGFAVSGLVFGYLGIAFWVLIIALVAAHS